MSYDLGDEGRICYDSPYEEINELCAMIIWGPPKPYTRARTRGNHVYLPSDYREWRQQASAQLREQGTPLGSVPVAVGTIVYADRIIVTVEPVDLIRPKGVRGDLDNYNKAVCDALADANIFDNDRQVVMSHEQFGQ